MAYTLLNQLVQQFPVVVGQTAPVEETLLLPEPLAREASIGTARLVSIQALRVFVLLDNIGIHRLAEDLAIARIPLLTQAIRLPPAIRLVEHGTPLQITVRCQVWLILLQLAPQLAERGMPLPIIVKCQMALAVKVKLALPVNIGMAQPVFLTRTPLVQADNTGAVALAWLPLNQQAILALLDSIGMVRLALVLHRPTVTHQQVALQQAGHGTAPLV